MQLKHFVVPIIGSEPFEEELNAFLRGHRVLDVKRELVTATDCSHWAISVAWMEGKAEVSLGGRSKRIDYREVLDDKDFASYAKLRDLRKEIAETEGVPPYAVFTNEQLAKMVTERVTDAAGLRGIDGIGEAKMERYGERFLAALAAAGTGEKRKEDRADAPGGSAVGANC